MVVISISHTSKVVRSWVSDNFHGITIPWESQSGEYEAPSRSQGSIPTYGYQSRLLPIGPLSDVTSTITTPSMVRPSTSVSETDIPQKKVDFSISPYAEETIKGFSQRDTPITDLSVTRIEDRASNVPRSTTAHDLTTLEVWDMDITTTERDVYHGIYPDFQLPLPNRPHISDLFVGNMHLISNTNSPMSILHIPSLKKMYGTIEYAIDQTMGQLYMVGDIDVTPINLFGGIPDEDFKEKTTEATWIPPKTPQAMSTPITEIPGSISSILMVQDSVPLSTPRLPIPHQEERRTSPFSSTHSGPPQ